MFITAIGAFVWLLLVVTSFDRLGVITCVLLIGPLIAVPLALPYVSPSLHRRPALLGAFAVAALAIVASNFLGAPQGRFLAVPWLVFALLLTSVTAVELATQRTLPALLNFGACAHLLTGASWWLLSRAAIEPLGFAEPIVELTAAHFHFAGFAVAVIAAQVVIAHGDGRYRLLAAVSALLTAGAPLAVAAGHLLGPAVELAGGVVTTLGLLLLAIATWLAPSPSTAGRRLVRYCSFPLILTMTIALQYGYGEVVGRQALSYDTIAAIHGGANALIFSCGSLLGWRLITSNPTKRPHMPKTTHR